MIGTEMHCFCVSYPLLPRDNAPRAIAPRSPGALPPPQRCSVFGATAQRSLFDQDAQHAAQRLGRAPEQLVADGEGAHIAPAPSPACGCGPPGCPWCRSRPPASGRLSVASLLLGTTLTQALSAAIMASMSASGTSFLSLKVRAWLWQRMAPTRTQKPSTGVSRCRTARPGARILLVSAPAFHSSRLTPLPRSLSIQGISEPPSGTPKLAVSSEVSDCCLSEDLAVDFQDGALRVVQQAAHFGVQRAELRQQFAHMLRAAAAGRLVGHGAHPFDQAGLVKRAHAHQHAADRAVAADPVAPALGQGVLDDRQVDRVQDDDGVVLHAQGGGGVDPVARPAGSAQLGETPRWCSRRPGR
jgi:hypothetical protein